MKKFLLFFMALSLFQQVSIAEHAVLINEKQTDGVPCSNEDYNFFQGYRAFWSYVIQKKPKDYPGYWDLVPETYKSGYTGAVCKKVVQEGYGTINLKTKSEKNNF